MQQIGEFVVSFLDVTTRLLVCVWKVNLICVWFVVFKSNLKVWFYFRCRAKERRYKSWIWHCCQFWRKRCCKHFSISHHTGKSLSEALFLASTNPQYDNRLFIGLQVQYIRENSRLRTWGEHVMYRNCFWHSEQFLYTTSSLHVLQK